MSITVESALTIGEDPERITEKINIGNVCAVAPEQKNERIKSSREIINTSNEAAKSAGERRGKVILKKVCIAVAPKSADASNSRASNERYRAYTSGTAYPKPKSVWLTINVVSPRGTDKKLKTLKRLTARTTSGTISVP